MPPIKNGLQRRSVKRHPPKNRLRFRSPQRTSCFHPKSDTDLMKPRSTSAHILIALITLGAHSAQAQSTETAPANAAQDATASKQAEAAVRSIHEQLNKVSKQQLRLKIESSGETILETRETNGDKALSLSKGLLEMFAGDRDALAALMAHEMAHQKGNHSDTAKTGGKVLGMLGSAIGGALDGKLGGFGIGQAASDSGAKALESLYTDSQENDANGLAIEWLQEAGFNPHGLASALRKLNEQADSSGPIPWLPAHRVSESSAEELTTRIDNSAKGTSFKPDAMAPIVVSQAAKAVPTASAVNKPSPLPKQQASSGNPMAPVDGVSLAQYAAIKNHIALKNETDALSKYNLSAERFTRIQDEWSQRMDRDSGLKLVQTYTQHYLESSEGQFTDWGKDVAQAMRSGKLQLGSEPTAPDDWVSLYKSDKEASAAGAVGVRLMAKAAEEKGMTVYDFHIINAWWLRRAKERAASGDTSLMQRIQ